MQGVSPRQSPVACRQVVQQAARCSQRRRKLRAINEAADPQPSGRREDVNGAVDPLDAKIAAAKADLQEQWRRLRGALTGADVDGAVAAPATDSGAQGAWHRLAGLLSGRALAEQRSPEGQWGAAVDATSPSARVAVDVTDVRVLLSAETMTEAAAQLTASAGDAAAQPAAGDADAQPAADCGDAAVTAAAAAAAAPPPPPSAAAPVGQVLADAGGGAGSAPSRVDAAAGEGVAARQESGSVGQEPVPLEAGMPEIGVMNVVLRTTPVLVWAALLMAAAQWLPLLPSLAAALWERRASPAQVLWVLTAAMPESTAASALQLDTVAVLNGQQLGGLVTAGLVHAGLIPALWCADGINNAAGWLEVRLGALQVLCVFLLVAAGAAAGQLLLGASAVGACCPGVCVGMYSAWLVAGVTRFWGTMPVTSDKGLLYTGLNLVLAAQQPAVGLGSILGGALAGAAAVPLAPVMARALFLAYWVPSAVALLALRVAFETLRLGVMVVAAFVVGTWRAVGAVVQTVREL